METVELPFGYYDRGSDFHEHLQDSESVSEALLSWAGTLDEMSSKLKKLSKKLRDKYVETDEEEGRPIITIEQSLADELLKKGLVEVYDEEDYDDLDIEDVYDLEDEDDEDFEDEGEIE